MDPDTLLTWQVAPPHGNFTSWKQAVDYCDGLRLAGHGDWRLPSISELRTLIEGCEATVAGGECIVSDDCTEDACQTAACFSCRFGEGPGGGCYSRPGLLEPCEHYWSATRVPDNMDRAWAIGFAGGFIYKPRIYYVFHARCVR